MQDLAGVKRNGNALARRVPEDSMTSARADFLKAEAPKDPQDLPGGHPRQARTHTATSRIASVTSPGSGSGSPFARRSSKWSRIASRMLRTTSS